MTEINGDKLLRGVVTKWTVWYRILRLSHGSKWPVVLQYTYLHISDVSKRTNTKEGRQFTVIMEHEEKMFFCFGLSLTRKSFWKLQLKYLKII
jgi:hypothetical protein